MEKILIFVTHPWHPKKEKVVQSGRSKVSASSSSFLPLLDQKLTFWRPDKACSVMYVRTASAARIPSTLPFHPYSPPRKKVEARLLSRPFCAQETRGACEVEVQTEFRRNTSYVFMQTKPPPHDGGYRCMRHIIQTPSRAIFPCS